jgi:hypothetical protein
LELMNSTLNGTFNTVFGTTLYAIYNTITIIVKLIWFRKVNTV